MNRYLVLLAALSLTACATATRWTPCPDEVRVHGATERGTVNGNDLAKLVQGGEADGVDSNYSGYSLGGAFHFKLGYPPSQCLAWGGEPAPTRIILVEEAK